MINKILLTGVAVLLFSTGKAQTPCTAVNVPYSENFDFVAPPALPDCTLVINNGTGNSWKTATNITDGFSGKVLRYSYSYTQPANTWFFTKGINFTAGTSYRIKYKYGATVDYPEKMKVAYGNSATSAGMTITLADHPNIINKNATTNFVDFIPVSSGVYYLGFQAYSDMNMFRLNLDDIEVYETNTLVTAESQSSETAKIYPNPFTDILTVSNNQLIKSIHVTDLSGRAVKTIYKPSAIIQLSDLSVGVYFITVTTNTEIKTMKFIKK